MVFAFVEETEQSGRRAATTMIHVLYTRLDTARERFVEVPIAQRFRKNNHNHVTRPGDCAFLLRVSAIWFLDV